METSLSAMPVWITILFIASFIFSISFIAAPARQAALASGMSSTQARNTGAGVYLFFLLWLTYASILALSGVLNVAALPPRAITFASLPLMVILFGVVANTRMYKRLLAAASLPSLIRLHIFRLLGVFFIVLYLYHLLPTDFAFSADLGDIITAIFAIPVANAVSQKKRWAKVAVYAWNIFGILDIVVLMTLAVKISLHAIATGTDGNLTLMTTFPFVWFPAFAPATILFLHYSVFKKLRTVTF